MWTPATRKNYSRSGLRYQSDVTDERASAARAVGRCARSSTAFSGRAAATGLDRRPQRALWTSAGPQVNPLTRINMRRN